MNELTEIRHVPIPLTEEERRELNEELVEAVNDKKRLEEHWNMMSKQHKKAIAAREDTIEQNAEALEQGHRMMPVKCRRDIDLNTNTLTVTRIDTGEQIEQRAMTAQERTAIVDQREDAGEQQGHKVKRKRNWATPKWVK